MPEFFLKVLVVLGLLSLVLSVYLLWVRPYQLRWGATDEEVMRPMAGDELNPHPTFLSTRAITINATPEEIWPWLIQMGYNRAGFYGYDIFENMFSRHGIQSADRILSEFQHPKVGDAVPMSAAGGLTFDTIVPNQTLIWRGSPGWGGFTWALVPLDKKHTRLVVRFRWSHNLKNPVQFGFDLLTEFADHLAVRKILQGVKGRVEGDFESFGQGTTEFILYFASLLFFVGAIILMLVSPLTWFSLFAGLAAGTAWMVVWYGPTSSCSEDPQVVRRQIQERSSRPLTSNQVIKSSGYHAISLCKAIFTNKLSTDNNKS